MAFTWTDASLTAGVNSVRAVHINELRNNFNALMSAKGYGNVSFTDTPISGGVNAVRSIHINQLRQYVEQYFRPSMVWSQQSGVTALNGRLTSAIPIRTVHIQELRNVMDQIHNTINGLDLGTASIFAIEGGSPTPSKHVGVTVTFDQPYNPAAVPNPTFVFTSSNTGALPTVSASPSIPSGATSFVFNFPSSTFGATVGASGYYTVSISNYPDINNIVSNSVTLSSDAVVIDCNLGGWSYFNLGANMPLSIRLNADWTNQTVTIYSSLGTNSGIAEFRTSGFITMDGNSTQIPYDSQGRYVYVNFTNEVTGEYLTAYPGAVSCVAFDVRADLRVVSLESIDSSDGDTVIDTGHSVRSRAYFNRARRDNGDSSYLSMVTPNGSTTEITISTGSAYVDYVHTGFPNTVGTYYDKAILSGTETTGNGYSVTQVIGPESLGLEQWPVSTWYVQDNRLAGGVTYDALFVSKDYAPDNNFYYPAMFCVSQIAGAYADTLIEWMPFFGPQGTPYTMEVMPVFANNPVVKTITITLNEIGGNWTNVETIQFSTVQINGVSDTDSSWANGNCWVNGLGGRIRIQQPWYWISGNENCRLTDIASIDTKGYSVKVDTYRDPSTIGQYKLQHTDMVDNVVGNNYTFGAFDTYHEVQRILYGHFGNGSSKVVWTPSKPNLKLLSMMTRFLGAYTLPAWSYNENVGSTSIWTSKNLSGVPTITTYDHPACASLIRLSNNSHDYSEQDLVNAVYSGSGIFGAGYGEDGGYCQWDYATGPTLSVNNGYPNVPSLKQPFWMYNIPLMSKMLSIAQAHLTLPAGTYTH